MLPVEDEADITGKLLKNARWARPLPSRNGWMALTSKRGGSSWAIFQTTAQSTPKYLWTARLRNARICRHATSG